MATVNNKVRTTKNKKSTKTNNNLATPKVNESITDTTEKSTNSNDQKSGTKKATLNNKVVAPRLTKSQELKQAENPTIVSSTPQNNQQVNSRDISKVASNINNISAELNKNTNNITPNTSLPTQQTTAKLEYKGASAQQKGSSNQRSNINFPINNDYKQNNNSYSQNVVNKDTTVEQKLIHKQSIIDNQSGKTEAIKQDLNPPMPNNSSNKSQNGGLFTSILNSIKSFLLGSPPPQQKGNTNIRQNTNSNNSKGDSLHSDNKKADRNGSNIEPKPMKNNQNISKQVSDTKQHIVQHINKGSTATQYNDVNNTQLKSMKNLPPRIR